MKHCTRAMQLTLMLAAAAVHGGARAQSAPETAVGLAAIDVYLNVSIGGQPSHRIARFEDEHGRLSARGAD